MEGKGKGEEKGEGREWTLQGLVDSPHVPNPEKTLMTTLISTIHACSVSHINSVNCQLHQLLQNQSISINLPNVLLAVEYP